MNCDCPQCKPGKFARAWAWLESPPDGIFHLLGWLAVVVAGVYVAFFL